MRTKIPALIVILSAVLSLLGGRPVAAETGTVDDPIISAGGCHSLAVKSDSGLRAWGDNDYGQLGDDTTADRHGSVRIGYDNNWATVSGGGFRMLQFPAFGLTPNSPLL